MRIHPLLAVSVDLDDEIECMGRTCSQDGDHVFTRLDVLELLDLSLDICEAV